MKEMANVYHPRVMTPSEGRMYRRSTVFIHTMPLVIRFDWFLLFCMDAINMLVRSMTGFEKYPIDIEINIDKVKSKDIILCP